MAASSSVSTTDSSSGGDMLEVVQPRLPTCRCPVATLREVVFIEDERFGRCFECLNRIDTGRLCAEQRFEYIVSLVIHCVGLQD